MVLNFTEVDSISWPDRITTGISVHLLELEVALGTQALLLPREILVCDPELSALSLPKILPLFQT